MKTALDTLNAIVWGVPVLCLILGLGITLTIGSKGAQFMLLPKAIYHFFKSMKRSSGREGITGYRALCTALAATVGTGNLAGVAGAIAIGGPGAVFWIWVSGFLGMITKCAEVTLAIRYRQKNENGEFVGGPMYIIQNALPLKYRCMAYIYCYFGIVAALGIGNAVQVNAVTGGLRSIAQMLNIKIEKRDTVVIGFLIAMVIVPVFRKGAGGIGALAEKLVPGAAIVYIFFCGMVLYRCKTKIPDVCASIFQGAFRPQAVTGGMIGSMLIVLRVGISRGIFTNEAGMGTASIAHASSTEPDPGKQGLMGIMEVFFDTIVICSLSAFVILCSGVTIPFGTDPGIQLTLEAFSAVLGNWSRLAITILTSIFAFATILGWGLYGARCCQFLFGEGSWHKYMVAQVIAVFLGAVLETSVVWVLSELVNGLMAIPNLFALYYLRNDFLTLLKAKNK